MQWQQHKMQHNQWMRLTGLGIAFLSLILALTLPLNARDQAGVGRQAAPPGIVLIAQGNGNSHSLSISGDGSLVAFASDASDLIPQDTNGHTDIFVYNRLTGQINRASLTTEGTAANGPSYTPHISSDGRYVVFASDATNLVLGDTNNHRDIFIRDLAAGTTERVSISTSRGQANGHSFNPYISRDGRYVVFESDATNLVSGDTNQSRDIFLHDRQTGVTSLVSVSSQGVQGDRNSSMASISDDGRYVAFESLSTNLLPNDRNLVSDVFLRDRDRKSVV